MNDFSYHNGKIFDRHGVQVAHEDPFTGDVVSDDPNHFGKTLGSASELGVPRNRNFSNLNSASPELLSRIDDPDPLR